MNSNSLIADNITDDEIDYISGVKEIEILTATDKLKFKIYREKEVNRSYKIEDSEGLAQIYPIYRCMVLVIIPKKLELNSQGETINHLFLSDFSSKNLADPNTSPQLLNYSRGGIINNLSKEEFEKRLSKQIGKENAKKITNQLYYFQIRIDNQYEYSTAITRQGNIGIYTYYKTNTTDLPINVKKEGLEDKIFSVIHSHIEKQGIFPSPEDLKFYAQYGVEFGITTNVKGTVIINNTNIKDNKKLADEISNVGEEIKDEITEKFMAVNSNWGKYANDEKKFNAQLDKFVNSNKEMVSGIYQKHLKKYGMTISYI